VVNDKWRRNPRADAVRKTMPPGAQRRKKKRAREVEINKGGVPKKKKSRKGDRIRRRPEVEGEQQRHKVLGR